MSCQSRIKRAFDEYSFRINDKSFLNRVSELYNQNSNISMSGTLDQYTDYSAKVLSGILPNSNGEYNNTTIFLSDLVDNDGGFKEHINNVRNVDDIGSIMKDMMDNQDVTVGREVFTDVMDQLSKAVGKSYEVISADEARTLIGDTYKGQKGFYFGNKAYVLDFATSLNIGIHEINHPFIDAIAESNPELFAKLVQDILSTNSGAIVLDTIKKDYENLDENYQHRELVTRFLSNEVLDNVEQSEDKKVRSIIDRVLFALRQLFRKLFGSKTSVSNLSMDTNLKQLADMLTSEQHQFDTTLFTESDIVQFLQDNKEMIEDLTTLKSTDLLLLIERAERLVGKHKRLPYSFKEVKETVTTFGSRSDFDKMSDAIETTKKTEDDFVKAKAFANILGYAQDSAKSIRDKIKEINKSTEEPNIETLNRLSYFGVILNDWKQLSDELSDIFGEYDIDSNSTLNKALADLDYNVREGITESGKKELSALVNTLGDFLEGTALNIKNDFQKEIDRLEELKKTNPSLQKRIDRKKKAFDRLDLSKENLAKYMKGEHGDANFYSGLLEAYISQGDPIVSSFAAFLEYNVLGANAQFRKFDNDMRLELADSFKAANVNRTNPAELANDITFKDEIFEFDEDGKPKAEAGSVIALLQKFKNYRYKKDLLDYNYREAKLSGDKEKMFAAKVEMDQFHSDYMHRKYKSEYYKLQDHWKTPEGVIANEARKEILDQIREYQNDLSTDSEKRDEELGMIDNLWRQYSQLSSLTNLDGTMKEDNPANKDFSKTIAETIREYNEKSREFYEDVEIKNLFETKLNEFKQSVLDQNSIDGLLNDDQIKEKIQEWIDKNTRKILTPKFYEDRQKILDTISRVLSKLPDSTRKDLEIEPLWKTIIEQTRGFRDNDGQIKGSDLSADKIEQIKLLQEQINMIQENYVGLSGLTQDNQDRLNELYKIKDKDGKWTDEQFEELQELKAIKGKIKENIGQDDFDDLFSAFQELKDLQSKVPTEYYMEKMDGWFSKLNKPLIDKFDIGEYINTPTFDQILNDNEEFSVWFKANHIIREKWVPAKEGETYGHTEEQWERLYNWNYIMPNDQSYYEVFKLSDDTPIQGKPNRTYYFRKVKKQYETGYNPVTDKVELQVGLHITNKHTSEKPDFLPKTMEDGAIASTYINPDYELLKKSKPAVFNILDIYTKKLLEIQEGLTIYNRIGLDVPRYRRPSEEYVLGGHLAKDVGNKITELKGAVAATFSRKSDDFQRGLGNYEDELKERLINYDMFGNELVRIPQTGLSKMDMGQVSLNIGESIMNYGHSAIMNKTLVSLQPTAKALIKVLEQQGVKDIKGISKHEFVNKGLRVLGRQSGNKNNRAKILRNMYETIWEGKTTHKELGGWTHKMLTQLTALTAYSSLSINVPGAIKNNVTANIQSFVESLSGEYINRVDYAFGQGRVQKAIPNILGDYNKFSDHSFDTQLMRAFDFMKGDMQDKLGREYANMNARYATNLGTSFMLMKTGEIQAQGAFFFGMLNHQLVEQTIDGVTKEIPYHQAFELVDGKLQLKESIDEMWAEGGDKFRRLQIKMHELSRRLQGNYAKSTQPEIMRYTSGAMMSLMRRYFTPMFINRFAFERASPTLGKTRTGYYTVLGRMIRDTAETHSFSWDSYSDDEKKAAIKTMGEFLIAATLYGVLRLLGWDSSDPDKYKKLEENSWAYNHLLYQIMLIKSEAEQFIPLPGLGGDEILRLLKTPSIAINYFGKWYRLGNSIISLGAHELGIVDEAEIRTQQKSGIWDKGTLKVYRDAMKVIGRTGASEDPITGIRNYQALQANPTR